VSVTDTLRDATGRVAGVSLRDRHGARRQLRARFVVGADGVRSGVARNVGARVLDAWPASGWLAYAYVAGLDAAGFEFHLGDRSFAGVFPTHGGEANVWAMGPGPMPELGSADARGRGFATLLARTSPALAARVAGAVVTSPTRSVAGLPNHVREAAGPGWALVGDAAYHRDPITGHGITDAFRDAELLARRLGAALQGEVSEGDALAAYAVERHQALAGIFDVTLRLAEYPPTDAFVALQKRLGVLIDAEATWLAALPLITPDRRGVAA
jgi:2-polyprenyl-6-methoxyphenol hydroxylase-like FAD-dependent oxidoreductase